jgi:type II secretion system (T2SS) protein C
LSKRVLLLNVILAGVAVFFAVVLVRDLTHSRPLPRPPVPRAARTAAPAEETADSAVAGEKLAAYNVIVTKHLFNPSRSEAASTAAGTPAAPPPPKPILLGVVVDGPKSRAYLEDTSTKRVFGYQIGDTIAGGRIDQITEDKVVIVRADGSTEVLLHDPSKPKPAAAPPPAGAAQRPGSPAPAPAPRAENPPVPGQPPALPRILRRLPTEQQSQSPTKQ